MKIYSAPHLPAGRVVVQHDGEIVAMGMISNLALIRAALSTPGADVYLNPEDVVALRT